MNILPSRNNTSHVSEDAPIADLVDFYNRWPELRHLVERIIDREELGSAERATLVWLVELADRVSTHDLDPPPTP